LVVHVSAETPRVERTTSVTVPADDEELAIRLPHEVLHGIVVDEAGQPVSGAIVNVTAAGHSAEVMQINAEADGAFAAHGLAPGNYNVQADDGEAQSEWLPVLIDSDRPPAEVRLLMHPAREVRGRVLSQFGPVPGAEVTVHATNVNGAFILSRTTDARGEFLFVLAPNAEELDVHVAPPGFAYTIGHVRWQPKKPVIVTVDQRGGTLVLRGAKEAGLTLRHEGALESLERLRQNWRAVERSDGSTAIEAMEPGVYTLCAANRCVEGFLPPHGSMTLDAR
jgi:hypothetical protein